MKQLTIENPAYSVCVCRQNGCTGKSTYHACGLLHGASLVMLVLWGLLIIGCSPTDPRAELSAAYDLLCQGKISEAAAKVDTCLDINNENVDAIILKTVVVYSDTSSDAAARDTALKNLQRATGMLARERFDAWLTYVWVLYENQDYNNALDAARYARRLYRAARQDKVPANEQCDAHDLELANTDASYARLLFYYTSLCAVNGLKEGMAFGKMLADADIHTRDAILWIALSRLQQNDGYLTDAYKTMKAACQRFPKDARCAYELAEANLARRRGMKMTPTILNSLHESFRIAYDLAMQAGDEALMKCCADKMAQIH